MGLKRDPLDKIFSDLVRERADWTCECCGREYPERKGMGLHCSHYWGRRSRSTRWHGDNCFAHCFGCHQRLGGNPHDFAQWVRNRLGDTRYDELMLRANSVKKYTKADKEEMKKHFKEELKKIKEKRMNDETGYIDFTDYD